MNNRSSTYASTSMSRLILAQLSVVHFHWIYHHDKTKINFHDIIEQGRQERTLMTSSPQTRGQGTRLICVTRVAPMLYAPGAVGVHLDRANNHRPWSALTADLASHQHWGGHLAKWKSYWEAFLVSVFQIIEVMLKKSNQASELQHNICRQYWDDFEELILDFWQMHFRCHKKWKG